MALGDPLNLRCDRPGTIISRKPPDNLAGRERFFSGLGFGTQCPRGTASILAALRVHISPLSEGGRKAAPSGASALERPSADVRRCYPAPGFPGLSGGG